MANPQALPDPLPCPFCAGNGYFESIATDILWWCGCRECGAETKPLQSKEEAISAWNRRATAAPVPEGLSSRWIPIKDGVPSYGERVMVLTIDVNDDPHPSLAHYNGDFGFLGYNAVRQNPVTHWQRIDPAPADWKLPPPKPRNSKHKQRAASRKGPL